MFQKATAALAACVGLATACSSTDGRRQPVVDRPADGVVRTERGWTFRTGEFTVAPGDERYLCYTVTLEEDLAVSRFSSQANPAIHHFLLAQPVTPEPEGFSDCDDVLYRSTWLTMYGSSSVPSEVKVPAGAAKILKAGSQILLQTHVANTTAEPVTTRVEVALDRSTLADPVPVGVTVFGSANVHLPAGRVTTVEGTCTVREETRIFAFLPHMHRLGRRLELEFGDDETSLAPAYVRDPYDFDAQYFDTFERTLPAGSKSRIRCTFENGTENDVHFGETTSDEMCFAVAFRVGGVDFDLCGSGDIPPDAGVPRAPDAGVCGEVETNGGIGKLCSPGGGQCPKDLFCSADFLGTPEGVCFKIGCGSSESCGEGSTCCALPIVGSIGNICLPEACRPAECIPAEMR